MNTSGLRFEEAQVAMTSEKDKSVNADGADLRGDARANEAGHRLDLRRPLSRRQNDERRGA
jgi:hypothetical protein